MDIEGTPERDEPLELARLRAPSISYGVSLNTDPQHEKPFVT